MIYELLSVGFVMDGETFITYPMLSEEQKKETGKTYDENKGIHLDDIESDDWFNELSDDDLGTVVEIVNKRQMY
jgi:hypothetical protein